jgi:carbon monoxide dehydrogenase subunit G
MPPYAYGVVVNITGAYFFDADQQTVWDLLMNPDAIAKALPGVDHLDPIAAEKNAWPATAKIGIASVSGTYTGTVRITDMVSPERYRLSVGDEGQGSIIRGSALLTVSYDAAEKKTLLNWAADANVSGRLAAVGQRLVAVAATMLANQFFRGLAHQLPGEEAQPKPGKEEREME